MKVVTEKETRKSVDLLLATNVDKRVTSPESAPTLLLRVPVVAVDLRVPRELDMVVELEPRDTVNLDSTTLPVNSDTKVKIELMVPAVEDAETVKEEKAEATGEMTVLKLKEQPLRNLPLTSRLKAPLSKAKRPRLRRPLKRFKKSLRKKKLASLTMNT